MCVYAEAIEMRRWSKPARRPLASLPAAAATGAAGPVSRLQDWPGVGLTTVVKDARLHDALQSMYIPPSLLRIGSTIGRGLYISVV